MLGRCGVSLLGENLYEPNPRKKRAKLLLFFELSK